MTANAALVAVAAQAMSDRFRGYTGTCPGEEMWNLNMETTWDLVAPAVVAAVLRAAGERIITAVDEQIRAGKVTDNGWIQGVKQTAEDLVRTADRLEVTP